MPGTPPLPLQRSSPLLFCSGASNPRLTQVLAAVLTGVARPDQKPDNTGQCSNMTAATRASQGRRGSRSASINRGGGARLHTYLVFRLPQVQQVFLLDVHRLAEASARDGSQWTGSGAWSVSRQVFLSPPKVLPRVLKYAVSLHDTNVSSVPTFLACLGSPRLALVSLPLPTHLESEPVTH